MKDSQRRMVIEVCDECTKTFARPSGRHKGTCQECRALHVRTNAESLMAKSGPTYEKLVKKSLLFWRSEAKRLNIRPE